MKFIVIKSTYRKIWTNKKRLYKNESKSPFYFFSLKNPFVNVKLNKFSLVCKKLTVVWCHKPFDLSRVLSSFEGFLDFFLREKSKDCRTPKPEQVRIVAFFTRTLVNQYTAPLGEALVGQTPPRQNSWYHFYCQVNF